MAVNVRDNAKNDLLWKEWATLLNGVIFDADAQQNQYDDLVKALYNVQTSKRWGEKAATFGGLGDYTAKTEGQAAAQDEAIEGYSKFIEHVTFAKDAIISKELLDDNQIEEAKAKMFNLVMSYKRTRAKLASMALVSSVGSTTTMTFGGKSIDISGADELALFNTAHPLKNSFTTVGSSSTTNVTMSNLFSNQLGSDTTILNKVSNRMRNFKDDRGEVLGFDADTVIIPGDDPEYEDFVKRIIGSDGEVGSNHNDINTQRGKWKLVVDYLWTGATGHPYIIMSSKANKALLASRFFDRTNLDIMNDIDVHSRNLTYNGFGRMSCGFTNWRHVAMGGVTGGTNLSA
jgi:hypothetical protein